MTRKSAEVKRSPATATKPVRMVVFIPGELRRELKVAAAERERSASDLVAEALRRFLRLE